MKLKYLTIILLTLFISCTNVKAEDVNSGVIFSQDSIISEEIEQPALAKVFTPITLNSSEVVFKQATKRIDLIDPVYGASSYPGGRGPNKLVIYTSSYGMHTGTNEFGTEAIVEGNIVTSLSGADSSIPSDGVVISGHGLAKNWISQNVSVGSKIFIDMINSTITVYTTSESLIFDAQAKIKEAQYYIDYYKNTLPNYNSQLALGHIQMAQNYLKMAESSNKNMAILKQYTQEAIDEANMAIKTSLPYKSEELKGIWLRPTEKSAEQIIATLDNLKSTGFNSVFLETYFHGKTIFPSKTMNKYGFTVQNEDFSNFDPLKIWIEEAHKRGIKVHTWFQSFYVGNKNPDYDQTSILSIHPDWGNKTKQYANSLKATKSVSEHNGYFLDPANPEVHEFLKELITEIITEYKPDGINLDYIRYPNSSSRSDLSAWGFTEFARNDFQNIYGVDPLELTTADALWYDWNSYRRNNVTKFVKSVGEIGKKYNVYVSAVIFPDIASALASKQQDWRNWSFNNYIDGFTPLFLTYDSKMLSSMMNDVISSKSSQTELYAGLFVTFMGGSSEDLIRQIFETRKMNANGVILFDYAHTTPVYTSTLMASAFNEIKPLEKKVAQKKKRKKRTKKSS
ncbi:family 10 glycosylhydrolase [bacterium]|nr:family 10 glycosylhydrolase [bacterium]